MVTPKHAEWGGTGWLSVDFLSLSAAMLSTAAMKNSKRKSQVVRAC